MNKEQKMAAAEEIGQRLQASNAVFAVDYRGISVGQAAELRTRLREADASFTVVKNRLAKRVTADAGAEALDEHLVGPTALTYVEGDAVLAAKAIADFIKANQTISYKGGIMEGDALDPDQFNQIARLPGVDVLRGQLVGLAASPLSGLVRTLNQLIAGIAVQLGQVAEQGLVGGDAAPPEEAAPAGEAAAEASADDEPEAPDSGEPAGSDEPAVDAEPPAEPDEPEETPDADDDGEGSQASETDESEPEQTDETDKAEAGDSDEAEADETKED